MVLGGLGLLFVFGVLLGVRVQTLLTFAILLACPVFMMFMHKGSHETEPEARNAGEDAEGEEAAHNTHKS